MNIEILKNKNFSLLIFGQATSIFGTLLLNIAISLYVLEMTGSAAKFAGVLTVGIVCEIILGPIAGTVADSIDRKKMIVFLDLIRGVISILLFVFSLMSSINIVLIVCISFFYSLCEVFFEPAFATILPSIVEKEKLTDANSILGVVFNTSYTISPFLGTVIFGAWGISIVFFIDGITYIVSAVSEMYMDIPTHNIEQEDTSFLKNVVEGFKSIFCDIRITSLLCNDVISHLFLFPFLTVAYPYIIIKVLHGTDIAYGTVTSVATIGSLLSIFAVSFAKKRYSIGKSIGISYFVMLMFSLLMLPLINRDFVEFISYNSIKIIIYFSLASFILYLMLSFYVVFYQTVYQQVLPENMIGRYVSTDGICKSLASLIGVNLYGYLFDNYGVFIPLFLLVIAMLFKFVIHIPFIREEKRVLLHEKDSF